MCPCIAAQTKILNRTCNIRAWWSNRNQRALSATQPFHRTTVKPFVKLVKLHATNTFTFVVRTNVTNFARANDTSLNTRNRQHSQNGSWKHAIFNYRNSSTTPPNVHPRTTASHHNTAFLLAASGSRRCSLRTGCTSLFKAPCAFTHAAINSYLPVRLLPRARISPA